MRGTRGRSWAAGVLVVAFGLGLGGCGDGATIGPGEGSVTATTELDGVLPDGWPPDISIPDGGSLVDAGSDTGDGVLSVVVLYAGAAPADIADAMKSNLERAGFAVDGEDNAGDQTVAFYSGKGYRLVATTAEQDGGAVLDVAIAPGP